MNYIVYDLEFNQKNPNDTNPTKLTFEIVQIGAVKLNNDLEITAVFNKIIRPSVHFEIHPYIENLTRITTEMVATENYFPEVYNDFLNFIGKEEQKIYTEQLFAQFEKMYNRKLSPNEKDMIKLAYIMGKTNQFSK